MAEPRKKQPKTPLERVPTRKLIASIKRDIRQAVRAAGGVRKPKK